MRAVRARVRVRVRARVRVRVISGEGEGGVTAGTQWMFFTLIGTRMESVSMILGFRVHDLTLL